MVLRVARGREAVPLHGVGEDHRGPGVVDRGERVAQRGGVVPAEVAHRGEQRVVVEVGDERGQVRVSVGEPGADLVGVAAQQALVLRVLHGVDPGAQRVAAGPAEQLVQQPAVLDGEDLPAGRGEHPLDPRRADRGDDPVQGLAVEVDDPHHLAQLADHRVEDGLPDRALVELGVADQGVLPALPGTPEVGVDVAAGQRTPDRGGRADPHRAGRVVDRVGVLGPRRVGLQPAERAQRAQVALVELAEQVVDRVQHRGRVRLDRDPVPGPQVLEPQRGHDRRHRRRRRLVPAHLQPARVTAPVGRVDDRGRQPQHPLLDLDERVRRHRPRAHPHTTPASSPMQPAPPAHHHPGRVHNRNVRGCADRTVRAGLGRCGHGILRTHGHDGGTT